MNAVQEQYARVGGLAMMYMDHAVPICGGIMHHCLFQYFSSGDQNRFLGGRSRLNWALFSARSTMNAAGAIRTRREPCHDGHVSSWLF